MFKILQRSEFFQNENLVSISPSRENLIIRLNREYENSRENRVAPATKTFRIPNPFYFP
ncbi:hypothetical protein HMPREF3039_03169 [Akkermansia sp. KLE1798]|nr:hypothetical protein HMPREF3039_03169 [Akkermansia sp. KLE1798]